jgi:LacI family transcriptional regulator
VLKLDKLNIPTIFFDKVPAYAACNKVCTADVRATQLAAELLLSKNKKRVLAIFGNPSLSITQIRLKAFEEAMQPVKAKKNYTLAYAHNSPDAAACLNEAMTKKQHPDAIFCMSDEILMGVMKAVQTLKISVPEALGIVAISDGFIPQLYYPEVTYAETSGFKLGKLAFSRMMICIAGTPFVQTIVDDSVLVYGGSL